ncbi:MAG: hypothetical protein H0V44_12950 [Planctomycetes bacterium]|nr:hypothetical protein [Planctomycetota bacterium]
MTRFVIIAVLATLAVIAPTRGSAYDLTLPPVTVDATYTPGSNPSVVRSIVLSNLPTCCVVDGTPLSGSLIYQANGNPMNPPEEVENPAAGITWLAYSDPVDQVTSFIFCDIPIDPNNQTYNPNRHYGLCTIRIDRDDTVADPGLVHLFLTDRATGVAITGAAVQFNGATVPGAEVGTGQYRITANATTTATLTVTKSGYQTLSFTATVKAGAFGSLARTMVDPSAGPVTLTTSALPTTGADPIPVAIHFNRPVDATINDFLPGELTVTGGTIQSFDGGPQDYVAQIRPTGASVQVSVASGVVRDRANVANAASNVLTRTPDAAGPTVTIDQAPGQADPANSYPVRFAIAFSAPVTGFTANDIVLSASTPQPIIRTLTGSGPSYTLELSGMSGPGTITASIPADAANAVSGGRPTRASTSTDATVTWALPPNYSLPVIYSRLDYTAGFPPTEYRDVILGANAWVVTLPRDANTEIQQVSAGADAGEITVPDTALTDSAGTLRVHPRTFVGDTTDSFTYSRSPPGTPNRQLGYVHLTMVNNSDLDLTVGGAYVTLRDGTGAKISGASLSFGLTPADALPFTEVAFGVYRLVIGNVVIGSLRVHAAGFADYVGSVGTLTVGAFPESTVVLAQSSLVASITSPTADPTRSRAITLTIAFSTAVADFAATDLTVTNGAITGFAGAGGSYTATLVPGAPGPVRVDLASGAANAGGFACNAAIFSRVYDTSGPTVTIDQAVGQSDPAISGPLAFRVVFSAPVTGFTGSDLRFAGGTAPGTFTAVVTGSGTTWTANVSGMTGGGTVVATVAADAAITGGHPSAASTSTDNSIVFVPPGLGSPSVTIAQHPSQPDPTRSPVVLFAVHFSVPVSDFTAADVLLTGSAGATTATVTGSGTDYTVLVSGLTASGTVLADIPLGAASSGGLPSFAANTPDNQVSYQPTALGAAEPTAASGRSCGPGSGLAVIALMSAAGWLAGARRRRPMPERCA